MNNNNTPLNKSEKTEADKHFLLNVDNTNKISSDNHSESNINATDLDARPPVSPTAPQNKPILNPQLIDQRFRGQFPQFQPTFNTPDIRQTTSANRPQYSFPEADSTNLRSPLSPESAFDALESRGRQQTFIRIQRPLRPRIIEDQARLRTVQYLQAPRPELVRMMNDRPMYNRPPQGEMRMPYNPTEGNVNFARNPTGPIPRRPISRPPSMENLPREDQSAAPPQRPSMEPIRRGSLTSNSLTNQRLVTTPPDSMNPQLYDLQRKQSISGRVERIQKQPSLSQVQENSGVERSEVQNDNLAPRYQPQRPEMKDMGRRPSLSSDGGYVYPQKPMDTPMRGNRPYEPNKPGLVDKPMTIQRSLEEEPKRPDMYERSNMMRPSRSIDIHREERPNLEPNENAYKEQRFNAEQKRPSDVYTRHPDQGRPSFSLENSSNVRNDPRNENIKPSYSSERINQMKQFEDRPNENLRPSEDRERPREPILRPTKFPQKFPTDSNQKRSELSTPEGKQDLHVRFTKIDDTDSSKPGSPKQQVPKVEANGHVKSPMKIPDLNKNDKGTPSKSLSPKTPDSVTSIGGDKKKVPMNKVQVGAAPSPNLKVVRSKIGSLGNSSYKPGGGKVKIENRKLDWKAEARIEAKNQAYAPKGGDKKIPNVKLQWNAKPKIGSLENATYKPGGGDKKIESVKLDFKEKAKPKVGSKDNLKHTPGGGTVKKSVDSDGRNKTIDIEEQKLDIKAQSKIGSMENVKHKPGGGDKKIFDDKDYLRQKSATSESSRGSSEVLSGTQDLMDGIEKLNLLPEIDESLENNEEKTPQTNVSFSLQRTLESSLVIAEQANNKLNEVKKMEMAKKMEPLKKAQKSEEDDQSNLPNQITKDDKDSKNKDLGAKEGSGLEGKLTEPQDTKKITKDEKEQEVEKGETGMTVEKPGREGTIKESGTEDMGRSDKEENKKVSENEENVGSVEKSEKLDKLEYGVLQKENKSEKKEIVGEKVEKQELGKEKDAKAAEKEIGKDDEKSEFDKNGLVETSIPEFHAGTTEEIEPTEKEINPFVKSLKTIRSPELTLKEVEEKSKFQDSGKSETLKPEKEDIQQQNQEVDLKKTLNPIVGGDLVIFGPKPLPQETSKIELEKKEDLNESSLKVKKGLNGKVEKSESGKTELAEKKKSEELNWHSEDQKEEHESEKDTKKSKEVQESILNSNILKEPSQHEKL